MALPKLARVDEADALRYRHVTVEIDRTKRTATFTVKGPQGPQPTDIAGITAAGAAWYPLQMGRELDDAILQMRTNELDIGTWLIKTEGDVAAALALDATLLAHQGPLAGARDHRPAAPQLQPAGCEQPQPVCADRARQLLCRHAAGAGAGLRPQLPADAARRRREEPDHRVTEANFGLYPMVTNQSRLGRRFYDEAAPLAAVRGAIGQPLDADAAFKLGLVTSNPDDIDWADEVRIAIEERVAMSPDALTGLEANLRFNGPETMATRVFGRLTAWQNWIFQRPNAVGEKGALKVYGKGDKAAVRLEPRLSTTEQTT